MDEMREIKCILEAPQATVDVVAKQADRQQATLVILSALETKAGRRGVRLTWATPRGWKLWRAFREVEGVHARFAATSGLSSNRFGVSEGEIVERLGGFEIADGFRWVSMFVDSTRFEVS